MEGERKMEGEREMEGEGERWWRGDRAIGSKMGRGERVSGRGKERKG